MTLKVGTTHLQPDSGLVRMGFYRDNGNRMETNTILRVIGYIGGI